MAHFSRAPRARSFLATALMADLQGSLHLAALNQASMGFEDGIDLLGVGHLLAIEHAHSNPHRRPLRPGVLISRDFVPCTGPTTSLVHKAGPECLWMICRAGKVVRLRLALADHIRSPRKLDSLPTTIPWYDDPAGNLGPDVSDPVRARSLRR